jgi:hypothetical protein
VFFIQAFPYIVCFRAFLMRLHSSGTLRTQYTLPTEVLGLLMSGRHILLLYVLRGVARPVMLEELMVDFVERPPKIGPVDHQRLQMGGNHLDLLKRPRHKY